jgi:uncharacterized membrane protein YukC
MAKDKKFVPYTSYFNEGKEVSKKSKSSRILERAIKELYSIKRSLNKLKEEEEVSAEDISDAVDSVNEVIQDIIPVIGASDPAIEELIDAAKELENSDEEDFIMEAEDDDDKEDSAEDDKEDEEEKKEACKKKK